jgi:diguanylate cyclase (GGDEF)-like protein
VISDFARGNSLGPKLNTFVSITKKSSAYLKLWTAALAFLLCGQVAASAAIPRGFLLTLATDQITLLLMSSAVLVFLANARTAVSQTRAFWLLAASSWGLTLVAQSLWMYFDLVIRREVPNPFVGDILLFLSNVPFLAALLLQPNAEPSPNAKQQNSLDFALLLLWWLFLFLFFVVPWQFVSLDESRYGANFNLLNALMDVVLLSAITFSWWHSSATWRRIFAGFFVAQLLNALTAYWSNTAITRHDYFPGSWYDVSYAVALGSFSIVGLFALRAKTASVSSGKARAEFPFASLGMMSVLSIPAFGAWAAVQHDVPLAVSRFREFATLGMVTVMALLVFTKTRQLAAQLTSANQVLHKASTTDFLTGVRNRRFFDLIVSGEESQTLRAFTPSSRLRRGDLILYMVDIDDFKEVNDCFGHEMGDKVLIEVARRIQSLIRAADVLVRWGGDEFLIVSRDSNRDDAAGFALRILDAFRQLVEADDAATTVNVSIGWAAFPWLAEDPDAVSLEAVLGLADRALYDAKTGGKNRAVGVSALNDRKSFVVKTDIHSTPAYTTQTVCQSTSSRESQLSIFAKSDAVMGL